MLNLRKLLFGNPAPPPGLAPEVAAALDAWRRQPPPRLDEPHFHSRYVVVDVTVSGVDPEAGELQGIGAVGLVRGGIVSPGEVLSIDLAGVEGDLLDRRLMALLRFCAKAPLAGYRVPFLEGRLQRVFRERLGLDFRSPWIDLAWLLPDLFKERGDAVSPRESWFDSFAIPHPRSRDPVAQTLALARLMQAALPRAAARGADTPAKLIEVAQARRFLRQNA